ncbi:MAG: hypothetical protein U5K00_02310 [Melioribacteraceae bacterium]|nr:hypothetical protein [Melioribacteraceae bacterium]
MFMKKPQYRNFDYTPRFYDPEKDEELKSKERRKRRLGFRTAKARHRVSRKSIIYYLVILILGVLVYLSFINVI